jgi:L,D-transpeptidase catalytic domain
VRIVARGLPKGAELSVADGVPGTAALTWTPTTRQIRDYAVTFTAKTIAGPTLTARPLRIHLRVFGKWLLSGEDDTYRWAYINLPAVARQAPSRGAPAIKRLGLWTPENTPNLVLALNAERKRNGQTWVRVRLSMLPNNSTGWVLRGALGHFNRIRTHLIVSRAATVATLYRAGKMVWRARVGVGQPQWPTPRGEFFIRERLSGYNNPVYGPVAFGTSARSPVLTDWPGGGFVGIHGTNAPSLIPGRISHGCIRIRNAPILRLWRLMPVGTPLTVI